MAEPCSETLQPYSSAVSREETCLELGSLERSDHVLGEKGGTWGLSLRSLRQGGVLWRHRRVVGTGVL